MQFELVELFAGAGMVGKEWRRASGFVVFLSFQVLWTKCGAIRLGVCS